MRRDELAIEQLPSPRAEPRDKMRERDLRRVARAADHRFAEKGAPERYAVKPADQIVAVPAFDAVRVAKAKQPVVARLDDRVDPRRWPIVGGFGAQRDHVCEDGVGGDAKAVGDDHLLQAA